MKTAYLVKFVGEAATSLNGKFLSGPRTAKEVARRGYGVTTAEPEAWPFDTWKKANAKANIVARHFSMSGRNVEVVETQR